MSAPAATSFTLEPGFIVAAVVATAVYLRSARSAAVPGWRRASFLTGAVLIAATLNSPLETIAVHYLLLGHLLQNALIADWAPPLLLLGLTQEMGENILRRLGPVSRLLNAGISWPLWVVGWYTIHLTRPYTYALEHPLALDLEHAFLITIGLCFWWPVIVPGARRMASGVAVLYLLGAFVAGIVVAATEKQASSATLAIRSFSLAFFIPVYFAGIGLGLDLLHGFDVVFFVGFLMAACVIKAASVFLGARVAGEDTFSSWNLSVAMNARGGPGIVVASTAFAAGIIDQNFFAVLVLLAIVTSLAAGAWLERVPREKLLTRPDGANGIAPFATPTAPVG